MFLNNRSLFHLDRSCREDLLTSSLLPRKLLFEDDLCKSRSLRWRSRELECNFSRLPCRLLRSRLRLRSRFRSLEDVLNVKFNCIISYFIIFHRSRLDPLLLLSERLRFLSRLSDLSRLLRPLSSRRLIRDPWWLLRSNLCSCFSLMSSFRPRNWSKLSLGMTGSVELRSSKTNPCSIFFSSSSSALGLTQNSKGFSLYFRTKTTSTINRNRAQNPETDPIMTAMTKLSSFSSGVSSRSSSGISGRRASGASDSNGTVPSSG